MHTVLVKRGDPASLTLVVCADPRPHRVAWEWGSLRLDAGSAIGKWPIRTENIKQNFLNYTNRKLTHKKLFLFSNFII